MHKRDASQFATAIDPIHAHRPRSAPLQGTLSGCREFLCVVLVMANRDVLGSVDLTRVPMKQL